MDDAEQFMPEYLRFMRGLIDSNDLPAKMYLVKFCKITNYCGIIKHELSVQLRNARKISKRRLQKKIYNS